MSQSVNIHLSDRFDHKMNYVLLLENVKINEETQIAKLTSHVTLISVPTPSVYIEIWK
jgi:hypothetical protein